MKEKQIQTIFGKHNKLEGAFELKLCKTKSIRFDAVRPHQIQALKDIGWGGKGLYHKIADQTFGRAGQFGHTLKKPFDCFLLSDINAYIVICFYIPRKPKVFCYVRPYLWEKTEAESDKKSIRKEEIMKISSHHLEV